MAQFNRNRWHRVGATADQLDTLEAAFVALDPDAQEHESARLAGVADDDLRTELDTLDLNLPNEESDAKGGPGGNALPSPSEPAIQVQTTLATDSVAGHDAP